MVIDLEFRQGQRVINAAKVDVSHDQVTSVALVAKYGVFQMVIWRIRERQITVLLQPQQRRVAWRWLGALPRQSSTYIRLPLVGSRSAPWSCNIRSHPES